MCTHRVNTTSFDKGVLEDMTVQHLYDLRYPLTGFLLRESRPAGAKIVAAVRQSLVVPNAADILTGRVAMLNSRAVVVGDVVQLTDGMVAEVWFHVEVQGKLWSCVAVWDRVPGGDQHSGKFRRQCHGQLISSSRINQSVIYSIANEGEISHVVFPP